MCEVLNATFWVVIAVVVFSAFIYMGYQMGRADQRDEDKGVIR